MNLLMAKLNGFRSNSWKKIVAKKQTAFKMDPERMKMAVSGVALCSVGCSLCIYANFGIAPFQTFSMGLNQVVGFGLSYGTYCMLLNIPMLLVPLLLNRNMINISTFISMFLGGYIIDWTDALLNLLLPEPGFMMRVVFLLAGLIVMCYASALYYVADLGVSTYDAIPLIITERTKAPFKVVRAVCDLMCVGIGFVCGISVGVGTVATAFFTGPLITFFQDKIEQKSLPAGRIEAS